MAKPPTATPVVVWKKRVVLEHASPTVRAVRTDKGTVEFEYLDSKDALGGERWLDIERFPLSDFKIEIVSAVRDAFIKDASASMIENPILEKEN